MANFSIPIEPVANLGGAVSFPVLHIVEEATQTAAAGTPCQINATDGGVQAWDGVTVTKGIAGFLIENFSNLATTGAGAPQGLTPVLGPGSTIGSYAANPNQPLAVITPSLVPINDGGVSFAVAVPGTEFVAALGSSAATANTAVATANKYVGQVYGLTKDANGYWYVDINVTGANAVAVITQLDPRDAVGTVGGRVWFTVLPTAAQISA
jgi:hypothetical protein